jgi:hypothetical protein
VEMSESPTAGSTKPTDEERKALRRVKRQAT